MQTFLPYPDFAKSLSSLDDRRLGKQRVEAKQIINIIEHLKNRGDFNRGTIAWANHPATIMWEKNLDALKIYYNTCLLIWQSRGFQNIKLKPENILSRFEMPWWIGKEQFHLAHQSNLIRKDKEYYTPKFGDVPANKPYLWPKVRNGKHIFITI